MQEIHDGLKPLLDYLLEQRGLDFSGYHAAMLERRIGQRLSAVRCQNFGEYRSFLEEQSDEIDRLVDVVTINVSRFFRDGLTFEFLAERILPAIIQEKIRKMEHSLRVWSAGCAMGEEPYSVAILIGELLEKAGVTMHVHLFATDIDARALAGAAKGLYSQESVENVKFRLLHKYFIPAGEGFRLKQTIKDQVSFSLYDMLDKKHRVPPTSIFGDFDLVLCRNLLIYFNSEYQETIFAKLYQALAQNGCLILGEVEAPTMKHRRYFNRQVDYLPIYWKRGIP
ncbi:MAG: protein-glutamate O-methyltransferase CheR [Pseudomonadota bacterium]